MADEITTTTADDLTYAAAIMSDAIVEALYANRTAINMVRQTSIANFPSKAKDFPITPTLAAASLTEGTDLSNTAFSTTKATITAGEVGIMLTPTDVLSVSDIVDNTYYAMQAGESVADKLNTDIAALSAGFSTSVGPGTGNDLVEASIYSGIATLEGASVKGPFKVLLHTQQRIDLYGDIGTIIASAANTGTSARAETNDLGAAPDGQLGSLYGMQFWSSAAVPTANAGADRLGMMVGRDALAYVEKWSVRTELQRDASLRATEIVVTANYGVGEVSDTRGVGVLSDA